jgi:hypothetical protein
MDAAKAGFTIDGGLVEGLEDYAKSEGLSIQEAFETALSIGIEICFSEAGERDVRTRRMEKAVQDLLAVVALLGPPALGVLRLLVVWAAREGFGVSEDELYAEILSAARSEWAIALAEHGVVIHPEPAPES